MTLSGRAALERPETDLLTASTHDLVVHVLREVGKTRKVRRISIGPNLSFGAVNAITGTYRATANALTETQRRAAGIRRNGRPRRRTAAV